MKETNNIEVAKLFFAAIFAENFDRAFADYANSNFRFVAGSMDNPELQKAIPLVASYASAKQDTWWNDATAFFGVRVSEFRGYPIPDAGDKVFVEGHFRFKHKQTGKIADSDWLTRFDMSKMDASSGGNSTKIPKRCCGCAALTYWRVVDDEFSRGSGVDRRGSNLRHKPRARQFPLIAKCENE